MKPLYRIILFILICWAGYAAFRQTLGPQQSGLLDVFQYFELILLIILILVAIVSDITAYRSFPKLFQFYSSITGLFLCTIILFRLITFNNIQASKTLFTASTSATAQNVLSVQFKENGYLSIEEFNRLGSDIYFGKYYQDKDTITILQTNYERFTDSLPLSGIIYNGSSLVWKNGDTMLVERNNGQQDDE